METDFICENSSVSKGEFLNVYLEEFSVAKAPVLQDHVHRGYETLPILLE